MERVTLTRPDDPDLPGPSSRTIADVRALLLDAAAVLVFVLVGRRSHGEGDAVAGIWATAWPFLLGVAGGYVGLRLTRWPAGSVRGGALVAGETVILGLVVRYGIQDNSFPLSFAIVAAVVLTVLMLSWRLLARLRLRAIQRTRDSGEPTLVRRSGGPG